MPRTGDDKGNMNQVKLLVVYDQPESADTKVSDAPLHPDLLILNSLEEEAKKLGIDTICIPSDKTLPKLDTNLCYLLYIESVHVYRSASTFLINDLIEKYFTIAFPNPSHLEVGEVVRVDLVEC